VCRAHRASVRDTHRTDARHMPDRIMRRGRGQM
jgi:hypothetical protein